MNVSVVTFLGSMLPQYMALRHFLDIMSVKLVDFVSKSIRIILIFLISNSWDIVNIEFVWWWGVCKVTFMSSPTKFMFEWAWVELCWVEEYDKICL